MKLSNTIIISVIAHAVLIALLAINFQFSKVDVKQTQSTRAINAHSVNAKNIERLVKNIKKKDIDEKNKETERLRKLKKEEGKTKEKRIEEKNKLKKIKQRQADAEKERKVEENKAADAKKKREVDDKARKKKKEADKKRSAKKKADKEKKRKKKLADEKQKKEEARKKKLAKEEAAQEVLEREMQQQMDDETEALNAAKQQQVMTEVDKFKSLIQGKIKRNWLKPEASGYCVFRINLAPGGLVIGVAILEGDNQHCESGQRAIYKAEPLPVSKDPDVFAELRNIKLTLRGAKK